LIELEKWGIMENHLIVGAKITDKLQENLEACLPAYQFYFKDNNPEYLQIVRVEGDRVIGKKAAPGIPVSQLTDLACNVRSILKKVCPDYAWKESDIKVFVQTLIG
jgi:hypothetical protein